MKTLITFAVFLFAATTAQAGWLWGPNVVEHHYYGPVPVSVGVPVYATGIPVRTRSRIVQRTRHIHVHGRTTNVTIIQWN